MNAEVQIELEDGRIFKYSVTPQGDVYEIRHSGWRKVTSPYVREAILTRMAFETRRADA